VATVNLGIAQLTAGDLRGPSQFPLKLALATLATVPVAVVFVIFQRYFVRGIGEGAVKG
jgi:multiple sugar transport system permease protein